MTEGGDNAKGKKCIFPFIYHNISYTKCTFDNAAANKPWCSTLVNESNNHHIEGGGNWGVCMKNCPIEGNI